MTGESEVKERVHSSSHSQETVEENYYAIKFNFKNRSTIKSLVQFNSPFPLTFVVGDPPGHNRVPC